MSTSGSGDDSVEAISGDAAVMERASSLTRDDTGDFARS
jgi:hypothetical protein